VSGLLEVLSHGLGSSESWGDEVGEEDVSSTMRSLVYCTGKERTGQGNGCQAVVTMEM
jgi:hypothetical protein